MLTAVAARTERIRSMPAVTVPPLHHPRRVAESWATVDPIGGGRVDLACGRGFDKHEYDRFGVDFERNAEMLAEGLDVVHRAWTEPGRRSPAGRAFAARAADSLFAVVRDAEHAASVVAGVAGDAVLHRRFAGTCAITHVVCRETEAEARDFYDDDALRQADDEAVDRWVGAKTETPQSAPADLMAARQRVAGGHGSLPLIGLHRAGVSGASLSFLDFRKALPFFIERVLPLLERPGVEPATHREGVAVRSRGHGLRCSAAASNRP